MVLDHHPHELYLQFNAVKNGVSFFLQGTALISRNSGTGAAKFNVPGWGNTPHPENVVKQFRRRGE
jgi:hypothetical protein